MATLSFLQKNVFHKVPETQIENKQKCQIAKSSISSIQKFVCIYTYICERFIGI